MGTERGESGKLKTEIGKDGWEWDDAELYAYPRQSYPRLDLRPDLRPDLRRSPSSSRSSSRSSSILSSSRSSSQSSSIPILVVMPRISRLNSAPSNLPGSASSGGGLLRPLLFGRNYSPYRIGLRLRAVLTVDDGGNSPRIWNGAAVSLRKFQTDYKCSQSSILRPSTLEN
jgi:hypothetical protein